jgi:hypothetical protein
MPEPLTDDEKAAWRELLEHQFEFGYRPIRLTVDSPGGQRYSVWPDDKIVDKP